jgi:hypothetical protein
MSLLLLLLGQPVYLIDPAQWTGDLFATTWARVMLEP